MEVIDKKTSLKNPLISVILITYNSGKYVLQALESIKNQTYKNLELIISDDCSTDQTKSICNKWINTNSSRFVRAELIVADKNTGVSANCNRGLNSARGEWIKLIAGDDMLIADCIESNIRYAGDHNEASFIFSNGFTIDENGQKVSKISSDRKKLALDNCGQYKELLKSAFLLTPSAFIKRNSIISLGGYNEKIPMMEDYPMWLKAVRAGNKLYHLDQETVLYRKHAESISGYSNNKRFMEMVVNLYDKQIIEDILRFKLYGLFFHIWLINKAHEAFTMGETMKFHFYSVLRYLIPSFLLKTIIKKVKVIIS